MIITDEKIEVAIKMLAEAGMTRYNKIGVPTDNGLYWKTLIELNDSDFNKIENYFLNKS